MRPGHRIQPRSGGIGEAAETAAVCQVASGGATTFVSPSWKPRKSHNCLSRSTADGGSVRRVGDRLVVERTWRSDERGHSPRRARARPRLVEDPAQTVRRAIEIGTRVLDREDTAVEVDYVRARVRAGHQSRFGASRSRASERRRAGIEERCGRALTAEIAGAFGAEALDSHSEDLAEQIAGDLRRGAARHSQPQLKRMLEQRDEGSYAASRPTTRNPLGQAILRNWAKERQAARRCATPAARAKLRYERCWPRSIAEGEPMRGCSTAGPRGACGGRGGRHAQGPQLRGRASTRALERIAATRGELRPHWRRRSPGRWLKEGRHAVEIGAGRWPGRGPDRLRDRRTSSSPRTTRGPS